jgi:hypothetical protein
MKGTYTNGKIESFWTRPVQFKKKRCMAYRREWINWENSNGASRTFKYRAILINFSTPLKRALHTPEPMTLTRMDMELQPSEFKLPR